MFSCLVMSDFLRHHALYPARLLCPWSSPGQEYCRALPFPSPGHLPHPGIKPVSPSLQADPLPSEPLGNPNLCVWCLKRYFMEGMEKSFSFSSSSSTVNWKLCYYFWLFFKRFVNLFFCLKSWLWHMGSSLHHVGSLRMVHRLSSCWGWHTDSPLCVRLLCCSTACGILVP